MRNKANVEVFSGFEQYGLKYPEYEVITPQGMKSYTVRAMNVRDEENLKGSLQTNAKLSRHLSLCIWDCIIKKPDDIKTFDDFVSKTTIKDRDALLFGIYVATYKDDDKYSVTCGKCGFVNQIKVNPEKWFTMNSWMSRGDNFAPVLEYHPEVELKTFKGIKAVLKTPTLLDEINVTESNAFNSEQTANLHMKLTMIDKFIIEPNEKYPNGDSIEERDNILAAYESLPTGDRKLIDEVYVKEFADYCISVKGIVKCTRCKQEREMEIDITQQFFRSLQG